MPLDLPPEIEDQIFECAARMHPKYAPTLSVVSKRVQLCVERVIYESLHLFPARSSLPSPRSAEVATMEFFKPTLLRRPAKFFATHVRRILFENSLQYRSAKLVLEKCTGLEHLVFLKIARHPEVSDAGPLIFPSAHTLQSLMTTRDVLKDMADSGIVCPRLRYLWIDVGPYFTPVPALKWFLVLCIVELFLYKEPGTDNLWEDDTKTVLSTTQNLQVMGLHVHEDHLDYVEQWKETVVSPVKIKTRVYMPFEGIVLKRWRRLTISVMDVLLEV